MRENIFENYPVPRAVATLALPTVLSMLVTIFYNMADTFFVGQTGDANQVAAVSLATPVFLLFMACGNMFGIGGSSFISRLLGAGDRDRVKKISSFCFYGGIVTGLVLTVLMLAGMPVILRLIGCSEFTEDYARSYLTYIALGGVFIVISTAFGNIVRGEGAAKASMAGMMIGTVVNIILDPIMILAMDMGVAGAAIATVIGNMCSILFYIFYLLKRETVLSISPKDFSMKEGIPKGVFTIGVPASITNVLMSAANIILNVFLASYGDIPVAAMGVAAKANMLVVFVQMGIAMGVQPLVGYCYGAKRYERMKKTMQFAAVCNVVLGTILTGIYFLFTESIIKVFIDDVQVIEHGIAFLRALMLAGPVIGVMFVFNFTFQAMGKALPSLILSLSRQGLVFLPVLLIGNAMAGLNGIVYAQPLADIASLLISLGMFVWIGKGLRQEVTNHNGDASLDTGPQAAPAK